MDPKFLRIGNYVNYVPSNCNPQKGYLNKIDAIDLNIMSRNSSYLEKHEPIPLTREIVKMCKFRFKEQGFHDISVSCGLSSGDIHFVTGNHYKKIRYVHQLQNLYLDYVEKPLEISWKEQ